MDTPDSMEIAWVSSTLGYVEYRRGDDERSLELFRMAVDLQDALSDEQVTAFDRSYALNNLGGMLTKLGRADEAIPLLERSLAISRSVYDDDHPLVGRVCGLLTMALLEADRVEEARNYADRAHAIMVRTLGEEHINTTRTTIGLVAVLLAEGRPVEAMEKARWVLETRRREYGDDAARTADARLWVARAALALGEPEAAERELDQALAVYGEVYPEKHRDVVEAKALLQEARIARERAGD